MRKWRFVCARYWVYWCQDLLVIALISRVSKESLSGEVKCTEQLLGKESGYGLRKRRQGIGSVLVLVWERMCKNTQRHPLPLCRSPRG